MALIDQMLGSARMGDIAVHSAICASGLDQYQGRIFTNSDRHLLAADVALASSAAPTYFPAGKPTPPKG